MKRDLREIKTSFMIGGAELGREVWGRKAKGWKNQKVWSMAHGLRESAHEQKDWQS